MQFRYTMLTKIEDAVAFEISKVKDSPDDLANYLLNNFKTFQRYAAGGDSEASSYQEPKKQDLST